MGQAERQSPLTYAVTSRSVLAGLAVIAVLSWVYLARNDDWRGWVFAVPSTIGLLAVITLRRMTRTARTR
ncbi:MAG TPA: hypothetical protein VF755_25270 [Catenuloplanes sp.]